MSKYNALNVLMGKTADYNDKCYNGRSLKFLGYMSDEDFNKLVQSLKFVDYVTSAYKMRSTGYGGDYVRIFVKDVK